MVVASPTPICDEFLPLGVPVVDLSWRRELVVEVMVRACEDFGFFKVINHGMSRELIAKMEALGKDFFALPADEKRMAGPPNPLGYGSRNIGFNGDTGELEYLLLHTSPASICQRARAICKKEPTKFGLVMNEYVEGVRKLACEILDMLAEGLGLVDKWALSRPLRDSESDSLLRLNHYPAYHNKEGSKSTTGIGFGEHSDPQILTILRSNDVEGLQILAPTSGGGVWVPVPSDPTAFYLNVGDTLEALTNGRLVSVRHRVIANSYSSRLSVIYFGAPPLHARISALPELVTPDSPRQYRSYTWAEYKKAMYSLRLGYNRLNLFRADMDGERTNSFDWL